jgi:RimJ/RimL family protein N-acetyltransferase
MIVKKVTNNDSLDILSWRNDKKTIFFSANDKLVSKESHKNWLKKCLSDPRTKFYMGYLINKNEKKKIGVVRFDIKTKYALVSINLNPRMRGKKLSSILLSAAIKKFLRCKNIKLVAQIKNNNIASISCFLKNNFFFFKSKNQYVFFQRNLD